MSGERQPSRITPTLEAVEQLWREHPDWRLGQLIYNLAGRDPFYIEDGDLALRAAQRLAEGW